MNNMEYENFDMKFTHKGYGRIFVEKESDVQKLENLIKEIDAYEFDYYPTGDHYGADRGKRLVTVFSEENYHSIYVHKFDDMDMGKLMKKAWEQGIHCFVVFGKIDPFDGE